jgi:hypothetical protein
VADELGVGSVPIFSAFYEGASLEDGNFVATMNEYYERGIESTLAKAAAEIARSFIQTQLLPADLLLPQTLSPFERSARVTDTAKKLSTVTLFGFSFGSIILNAFDSELALALIDRGFSASEAAAVRSHLAILTIGDVAFKGAQSDQILAQWAIPAIHIASTQDQYAGPILRKRSTTDEGFELARLRALEVVGDTRIAITAPLCQSWYAIRGEDVQEQAHTEQFIAEERRDASGHTPPIYLTAKVTTTTAWYGIFIPVVIRSVVRAMLDPETTRPCEPRLLLENVGRNIGLQGYYDEYLRLLWS